MTSGTRTAASVGGEITAEAAKLRSSGRSKGRLIGPLRTFLTNDGWSDNAGMTQNSASETRHGCVLGSNDNRGRRRAGKTSRSGDLLMFHFTIKTSPTNKKAPKGAFLQISVFAAA